VPFKATKGTTLNTEWQQISIDISNTPITAVIGAFAWVSTFSITAVPGLTPAQTIYIDDIVWE
jgi:hypothetical protein